MTPGEIEKLPIPFQQHMAALENRILSDLINRLMQNREITSTADWQINRLHQLGLSNKEIQKAIKNSLNLTDAEIKKLYREAVKSEYARNASLYQTKKMVQIPYDKNLELQTLVSAVQNQTQGEIKNITKSLGFAIRGPGGKIINSPIKDFYQSTLDSALFDLATGAFDYDTVLRRTIQTLTNSGLRSIDYDSGRSYKVDTAVRMCVMTGFNQVQSYINRKVAKDLETNYYEVSYHGGARPSHQQWQGRVYSGSDLALVCGLGSAGGLCGTYCYHSYNAFIPGASVRTYTDAQLQEMNKQENQKKSFGGKQFTTYEALQEQRRIERVMRKQRQDIRLLKIGKANNESLQSAQSRYRSTMHKYSVFSSAMELPQQKGRIFQDGLGSVGLGKR